MAQFRQVSTEIWNNRKFHSLTETERYLFLYLKLNSHLTVAGCCPLSIELMALESGLSVDTIKPALASLNAAGLVLHKEDWLAVRDSHDGLPKSPKIKVAVDQQLDSAPDFIRDFLAGSGPGGDPRSRHPAIQAVRDVTDRFPSRDKWDAVIEIVGESPNLELMVDCWIEWSRRHYNPTNLNWLFDWYAKGGPPNGGKQSNSSILEQYAESFSN